MTNDEFADRLAALTALVTGVEERCTAQVLALTDLVQRRQARETLPTSSDWSFPARVQPPRAPSSDDMVLVHRADLEAIRRWIERLEGQGGTR